MIFCEVKRFCGVFPGVVEEREEDGGGGEDDPEAEEVGRVFEAEPEARGGGWSDADCDVAVVEGGVDGAIGAKAGKGAGVWQGGIAGADRDDGRGGVDEFEEGERGGCGRTVVAYAQVGV